MRTDIHSEKNIKIDDYRYVMAMDFEAPDYLDVEEYKEWVREMANLRKMLDEHGVHVHKSSRQCDHCGAHFKYGCVIEHLPTGGLLTVGGTCAINRFELTQAEFDVMKLKKYRAAALARRTHWLRLMAWGRANRECLRVLIRDKKHHFIESLRYSLLDNHELTENQISAALRVGMRNADYAAQRAKEAAARALVVAGKRIQICGTVVSTKTVDGYYGSVLKMLVRDARGFLVYGTVPQSILISFLDAHIVGGDVQFAADIEASKDDPTFGFFRRPTKATFTKQIGAIAT